MSARDRIVRESTSTDERPDVSRGTSPGIRFGIAVERNDGRRARDDPPAEFDARRWVCPRGENVTLREAEGTRNGPAPSQVNNGTLSWLSETPALFLREQSPRCSIRRSQHRLSGRPDAITGTRRCGILSWATKGRPLRRQQRRDRAHVSRETHLHPRCGTSADHALSAGASEMPRGAGLPHVIPPSQVCAPTLITLPPASL